MWNKIRKKCFAVLCCAVALGLIAACAGLMAQEKSSSGAKKKDVVVGKADTWKSAWGGKKTTLMKGNVSFTHGETVIKSDQVDYDDDAKTAISPGRVQIANPECDITGDNGSVNFGKKLGIVEGNVLMRLKPKQSSEPANADSVRTKLNKPTTITCKKVEYLYKKKIATATGGVVFAQEKRRANADKAVYSEAKELLTLTGNVSGVDEEGQTFSAPGTVVISLKKDDEWMEAQDVNASFKIDLTEEEESKSE